MLRFLLYAVIAYFLYQFIVAVDWGGAFSSATHEVSNTTSGAVETVENSSIVQTIGDAFSGVKNFLFP